MKIQKNCLIACLLLLTCCLHGADAPYKVFYLGLEPKAKVAIIEDFLSDSGKIFLVGSHKILIRDKQDRLDKVDEFLNSGDIALVKQVRVRLKKLSSEEMEELRSSIGIKIDPNSVDISWQGRQGRKVHNDSNAQELLISNGSSGELELNWPESEIIQWRNRLMPKQANSIGLQDGVKLAVTAVIAGKYIKVQLQSVYWANIGTERITIPIHRIQTSVILTPGKWMEIAADLNVHTEKDRKNLVLDIKNEDSESSMHWFLMAEIEGLP